MPRCNCDSRTHDGSFPLLLPHFADCHEFGQDLRTLIEGLVRGMESWAADEDGIHPDAWQAYQRAKLAIGEPVNTEVA